MRKAPQSFEIPLEVPERTTPLYHVIGSRTYLTDCVVPQLEIVVRYPRRYPSYSGRLVLDEVTQSAAHGGRRDKLRARLAGPVDLPDDRPYLDVRPLKIVNWSHALNHALPLAIKSNDAVREHGWNAITVVLPDHAPANFVHLLDALGLSYINTNLPVRGRFVRCEPYAAAIAQHFAREWLAPHMPMFRRMTANVRRDLPKRFFLDRRRGRHLLNGDDVRAFLARHDFVAIHAEDFSPEEQLALFQRAEDVVAIHGAGLAPIMYRTEEDGPLRLIEILSPGLMVGFFSSLTEGLPIDYRFLRGTPTSAMAADAYRVDKPRVNYKRAYDMAPFELDLSALEVALRRERIEELLSSGEPLFSERGA